METGEYFIPKEIKIIIFKFLTEFNHIHAIEKNPRRYHIFRLHYQPLFSQWEQFASEFYSVCDLYINNKYSFYPNQPSGSFHLEYKKDLRSCIKKVNNPNSFFIYNKKIKNIKKLIPKCEYNSKF